MTLDTAFKKASAIGGFSVFMITSLVGSYHYLDDLLITKAEAADFIAEIQKTQIQQRLSQQIENIEVRIDILGFKINVAETENRSPQTMAALQEELGYYVHRLRYLECVRDSGAIGACR